jgi:hypothetical protein
MRREFVSAKFRSQSDVRCLILSNPLGVDMFKFSPTIVITTESIVVVLLLLRAFHVI